jgi:hypothetical protein
MNISAKGLLVLVGLACGAAGCADVDDEIEDEEVMTSEDELKAQPTADPGLVIANIKPSTSGQTVIAQLTLPADQLNSLECDWATKRVRLRVKLGKVTKKSIKVKSVRIEYVSSMTPASLTVFGGSDGDDSIGHGIEQFGRQGFVRPAGTKDDIAIGHAFPVQSNGQGVFVFFNFLDDDSGLGGKPGEGLACGRIAKLAFRVR